MGVFSLSFVSYFFYWNGLAIIDSVFVNNSQPAALG